MRARYAVILTAAVGATAMTTVALGRNADPISSAPVVSVSTTSSIAATEQTSAASAGAASVAPSSTGRAAFNPLVASGQLTADFLTRNAAKPVPPRLPASAFAASPPFSSPVLSPNGLRFAARSNIGGKDFLTIIDLTGKDRPQQISFSEKSDLIRYFWVGNDKVFYSFGKTVPYEDDEAYSTRLAAIDLTTGQQHFIGSKTEGLKGDDVLWIDPEGKTILLAYQPSIYEYPTVYSVDAATNRSTKVAGPFTGIWHWYADAGGTVRYGYGWPDDHHWQMVYRKDATQPFKVAARGTNKDDDEANAAEDKALRMAVGSDEGFTYATDKATGLTAVYAYNFATHTRGDLVFEAAESDIDDAELTEDGKQMFSAAYTDSRDRIQWWDPAMKSFQGDLDKAVNGALGEHEAWVISHNRDYSMMIVWVLASNDPGRYYIYQRANGKMSLLVKLNDTLPPTDLAVARYVGYRTRDNLEIPAYLTLPVGREAKGLPLIIMPHGGPYGVRDHGDFDADVQFLANRGYAVLQPEYRGSSSYGQNFADRGEGQWGRAMQDDLDDGMDWLVKQGIVDAKRVCLVGGSYGGYAAIWGATRNPERYRCAVSFAGISDLGRQLKYQLNSYGDKTAREKWRARVQGDAAFDLKTVSGLYNVDRLKVPMMLVHGTKDQTVPPKQSSAYADALHAAGKTYEFYELPGEGHGLSNAANAQIWYDRLDAFLAKYNPVR